MFLSDVSAPLQNGGGCEHHVELYGKSSYTHGHSGFNEWAYLEMFYSTNRRVVPPLQIYSGKDLLTGVLLLSKSDETLGFRQRLFGCRRLNGQAQY